MDITRFITFEPGDKALGRDEEVEQIAQGHLAKEVQQRLRNQSDPGIDLKSARRAQAIRVRAEGGQIVVDEDDQGKVLSVGGEPEKEESTQSAANLDDLFRPGSGVPEAVTRPDGSIQLVFRSIKASDLFNQQIEGRRDEMVERAISDVLRTGTVDAIEEAQDEIGRLYSDVK
jgi:hypothetical protein